MREGRKDGKREKGKKGKEAEGLQEGGKERMQEGRKMEGKERNAGRDEGVHLGRSVPVPALEHRT
jgi:hypothetical protein